MSTMDIAYTAGGETMTGYLADGSNGKPSPGVLVFHQANGLAEHTRERTRMLAGLGTVAFAADMYGAAASTREEQQAHLRAVMDHPDVLHRRARAGLEQLKSLPHVDVGRLAAVGFCFGGAVVLAMAPVYAELACVVAFHPGFNWLPEKFERAFRCKIMACVGADDPLVPAESRERFIRLMSGSGADWQLLTYGGAAHSFTDRFVDALNIPGLRYNEDADRRSWVAMRQLFDETLFAPSA